MENKPIRIDDLPDEAESMGGIPIDSLPDEAAPAGGIPIDALPGAEPASVGVWQGAKNSFVSGYNKPDLDQAQAELARLQAYRNQVKSGGAIDPSQMVPQFSLDRVKLGIGDLLGAKFVDTPEARQSHLAKIDERIGQVMAEAIAEKKGIDQVSARSPGFTDLQARLQQNRETGGGALDAAGQVLSTPSAWPEFIGEAAWPTLSPIIGSIVVGALTRNPKLGIATAMGSTGLDSRTSTIVEQIQERARAAGVDLAANPERTGEFIGNPEEYQAILDAANRRGVAEGAMSGVSYAAGMAPFIKGWAQPIVQSALEGGTEIAGQVAQKGEVYDPTAVGVSTAVGGLIEGPTFAIGRALSGSQPPPAAPVPQAAPAPAPSPAPAPAGTGIAGEIAGQVVPPVAEPAPQAQAEPAPQPAAQEQAPVKPAQATAPAPEQAAPVETPAPKAQAKPAPATEVPPAEASPAKPARDDAYKAAVEAGDNNTARRLLAEQAKEDGFTIGPVYHGTPTGGFNKFDPARTNTVGGVSRGGPSFTTNKKAAEDYSRSVGNDQASDIDLVARANKAIDEAPDNLELFNLPLRENRLVLENLDLQKGETVRDAILDIAGQVEKVHPPTAAKLRAVVEQGNAKASPEVKQVYLRLSGKPRVIKTTREKMANDLQGVRATPDSPVVVEMPGETIYYVGNPADIRSANLKVSDDAGAIVPPSRRFRGSDDLRGELAAPSAKPIIDQAPEVDEDDERQAGTFFDDPTPKQQQAAANEDDAGVQSRLKSELAGAEGELQTRMDSAPQEGGDARINDLNRRIDLLKRALGPDLDKPVLQGMSVDFYKERLAQLEEARRKLGQDLEAGKLDTDLEGGPVSPGMGAALSLKSIDRQIADLKARIPAMEQGDAEGAVRQDEQMADARRRLAKAEREGDTETARKLRDGMGLSEPKPAERPTTPANPKLAQAKDRLSKMEAAGKGDTAQAKRLRDNIKLMESDSKVDQFELFGRELFDRGARKMGEGLSSNGAAGVEGAIEMTGGLAIQMAARSIRTGKTLAAIAKQMKDRMGAKYHAIIDKAMEKAAGLIVRNNKDLDKAASVDAIEKFRASLDIPEEGMDAAAQKAGELNDASKKFNDEFLQKFWPSIVRRVGMSFPQTPKGIAQAIKAVMPYVEKFLKENPRYADYYRQDWNLTKAILKESGLDMSDQQFRLFRLMTGLTSPSTKLPDNMIDAVNAIRLWQDAGNFNDIRIARKVKKDGKQGNRFVEASPFKFRGTTGATKAGALKIVQSVIERFNGDIDQAIDFLEKPVTLEELNAFRAANGFGKIGSPGKIRAVVKTATGQDTLIPMMFAFGPKVGAYTLNALGDSRFTTTDIWEGRFVRTLFPTLFRKGTGLPTNVSENAFFQAFSTKFNEAFNKRTGMDLDASALQAVRWFYIIDLLKRSGYTYAKTQESISEYTRRAIAGLDGTDPSSGGRGDAKPQVGPGGGNAGPVQGPGAGRGPDGRGAGRKPSLKTTAGEVTNHDDADLAKRGFVTKFAANSKRSRGVDLKVYRIPYQDVGRRRYYRIELVDEDYTVGSVEFFTFGGVDNGGIVTADEDSAEVSDTEVSESYQGKGFSKILYAELGERLRRAGVTDLAGSVIDELGRPIKARQVIGETEILETEEDYNGEGGIRREVNTKIEPDKALNPEPGAFSRNSPEVGNKIIAALKGKQDLRVRDALQAVADAGGAKAPLAKILLAVGNADGLGDRVYPSSPGNENGGSYDYKSNVARIGLGDPEGVEGVALEEAIHALTLNQLVEQSGSIPRTKYETTSDIPLRGEATDAGVFDGQFRSAIKTLFREFEKTGKLDWNLVEKYNRGKTERTKAFVVLAYAYNKYVQAVQKTREGALEKEFGVNGLRFVNQPKGEDYAAIYRMSDFAEFVAGVLLDKDIQNELEGMKNPFAERGVSSFLRQVIDAIKQFFGIKGDTDLYAAAVKAAVELSAQERTKPAGLRSPSDVTNRSELESLGNDALTDLYSSMGKDERPTVTDILETLADADGEYAPLAKVLAEVLDADTAAKEVQVPDFDADGGVYMLNPAEIHIGSIYENAEEFESVYGKVEPEKIFVSNTGKMEYIALEEIIHAATVSKIPADLLAMLKEGRKGVDPKLTEGAIHTEGQKAVARRYIKEGTNEDWKTVCKAWLELNDFADANGEQGDIDISYRTSDMFEFIAGVLLDTQVAERLKAMPSEKKSLMRRLLAAVARIFGISSAQMKSLYGDVVGAVGSIIQSERTMKPGMEPEFANAAFNLQSPNGDVSTEGLKQSLDKWADETLKPGNLNDISQVGSMTLALAWKAAKGAYAGFAQFSKAMVNLYGNKVKPFLRKAWQQGKEMGQNLKDFATFRILNSIADKAWQNSDRNPNSPTLRKLANLVFSRSGPDADAVDNDIPTRIQLVRAQFQNAYARVMQRFAAEFSRMSAEQKAKWDSEFRDAVLGRITPSDPKLAQAVADYRAMMRQLLDYQRKAGVTLGDVGENYFPRVYSGEAVEADTDGFVQAAAAAYKARDARLGIDPKTDEEYEEMARTWARNILYGDLSEVSVFGRGKGKAGPDSTDPRTFNEDEAELLDGFLMQDVDLLTDRYIGSAVRFSEVARAFGEDGSGFGRMLNALVDEGVGKDVIEEMEEIVPKAMGMGTRLGSKAQKFFDWTGVSLAAMLGKSFVYNILLEPASFGIRTGNAYLALKGVVETWSNLAGALAKPSPAIIQKIEQRFGSVAAFQKSLEEAFAEDLGLIQVELEKSYQNAHWNYEAEEQGSRMAKWLINRIYRSNLMNASERAKVKASVSIARMALLNNAKFFTGNTKLQKYLSVIGDVRADESVATIFREVGIDDADHAAFAKFVTDLEGKSEKEWYDAVMDPNDRMAGLYRRAIQRASIGMSVKTNPALKTSINDSVMGRLLMQLMNYSYAFANLVKDRMYAMLVKAIKPGGDASALDRLRYAAPAVIGGTLATIAAFGVKELFAALFPSEGTEKRKKEGFWARAWDSASFAGMLGPKIEYLTKMIQRRQVPGGPTTEMIAGGVSAAGQFGINPGETTSRGLAKQTYRSVIKPGAIAGASAAHPFFGFLTTQATQRKELEDAFVTGVGGEGR